MALEGSIQEFGLPDIIQFLRQQSKTGMLTVEGGNSWTKVMFEGGMIVSVATPQTEEGDWVIQRLIRSERVKESKVKEALKPQHKDKANPEKALVEAGLIGKEELTQLLDLHIKETVFALFRLKEGRYRFEAIPVNYNQEYVIPLDAEFILLEGMRQYDEWPMIEKQINNRNIVFERVPELLNKVKVSDKVEQALDQELQKDEASSKDFMITAEEFNVYNQVDGQRNVQKLIDVVQVGEFYTFKALANLSSLGLIRKKELVIIEKPPTLSIPVQKAPTFLLSSKHWNVLLGVLLGLWVLVTGSRAIEGLASSFKVDLILEQSITEHKREKLEEAILVYYLKTSKLPNSLQELTQELPDLKSLYEALKSRGVRYSLLENGFVLDVDTNE